jgi:hypothetical protein
MVDTLQGFGLSIADQVFFQLLYFFTHFFEHLEIMTHDGIDQGVGQVFAAWLADPPFALSFI